MSSVNGVTSNTSVASSLSPEDALRRRRLRNQLMKGGKSSVAEGILNDCYKYMVMAQAQSAQGTSRGQLVDAPSPQSLLVQAIRAAMPWVETTTVKVGGASYQVPTPMNADRSEYFGVHWILQSSKSRRKKDRLHGMAQALALEVLSIIYDQSMSLDSMGYSRYGKFSKKSSGDYTSRTLPMKAAMHRTAKANRVFSHRRWR